MIQIYENKFSIYSPDHHHHHTLYIKKYYYLMLFTDV